MNGHTTPNRLLLVSVPRTASNLLLKILNIPDQPDTITSDRGGYFFHAAFVSAAKDGRLTQPPRDWTDEAKRNVQSTFQQCFDRLEECCVRAESEQKLIFAKEHSFWFSNPMEFSQVVHGAEHGPYDLSSFRVNVPSRYGPTQTFSSNNKTVFPDEYLRTWRMVFIIRHPALVFPSFFRAMDRISDTELFEPGTLPGTLAANMTLRWTRWLFEWCQEQSGTAPMLLDAYDVIHRPLVVRRFCELAGLDPTKMMFEWERTANGDSDPHCPGYEAARQNGVVEEHMAIWEKSMKIMTSTLDGSEGVMKEKEPGVVDIVEEAKKWRVEFGDRMAGVVEKAVWDAMPDYEYLQAQRFTI
ncbi:hypothetical protein BO71DRAFT_468253 [Aspergillus ellipticus CBS 707.79]|uniref:P-loop containing nucleoside triphosphate hydrolase protein n=1 Tax=Aspergillus ellipticus CBS 707.79 TaxID=1448320 RepID=A0A319DII8_9EURO|nr:hypothetical protein BO71DRAFT_468253 [Aspergillus ellipticus CBS 707.79]